MFCCRFQAKAVWVMAAARRLPRYRGPCPSPALVPVRRAEAAVIISRVSRTWHLRRVWTVTPNRPAVKVFTWNMHELKKKKTKHPQIFNRFRSYLININFVFNNTWAHVLVGPVINNPNDIGRYWFRVWGNDVVRISFSIAWVSRRQGSVNNCVISASDSFKSHTYSSRFRRRCECGNFIKKFCVKHS